MTEQSHKPEDSSQTFLKRLGGLTATLPSRTGVCRQASLILSHKAIQKHREREVAREEARREVIDELFRRRKQTGAGHYRWYDTVTRVIDF